MEVWYLSQRTMTVRVVGFISGGNIRNGDPGFDGELYAIYLLMLEEISTETACMTHCAPKPERLSKYRIDDSEKTTALSG